MVIGLIRSIAIDIGILLVAIALALRLQYGTIALASEILLHYGWAVEFFLCIWITVSFVAGKYGIFTRRRIDEVLLPIIYSSLFSLAIASLLMYVFSYTRFSRTVVFGSIGMATFIELIIASRHYFHISEKEGSVQPPLKSVLPEIPAMDMSDCFIRKRDMIARAYGRSVSEFISRIAGQMLSDSIILNTKSFFTLASLIRPGVKVVINLNRINDIQQINKFFECANEQLSENGIFIGCVETLEQRMYRLVRTYTPLLVSMVFFVDFIIHRILPKISSTKSFYFNYTRGFGRVISRAEALGRLYCCGFEIIAEHEIGGILYFAARKVRNPYYDKNPTYGPLVALKRIGKDGKYIRVYKMRTMHPYSEYLQGYIYDKYNLKKGGKFHNDFRVNTLGRLMRKTFIDELPMLINFFKGDMKIVGVRPLSHHYFHLYSKELQELRIKFKPGLVPPFYADRPVTLEEIQESEMRYLRACEKNILLTDIRYFFKSMINILFRHARSS